MKIEEIKKSFNFSPFLNDNDIGIDLLPNGLKFAKADDFPFPILTAEWERVPSVTHHQTPHL